ncbi:MAG TPA: cob(I)yrinic acid a,c-diamide adenosyltransferase [Bacteriovoracaceae bacterium]|nr:cob(I)yrinic acid a,c-diamide adenosyltransferase [Bacteriovoracaceae bacterium]
MKKSKVYTRTGDKGTTALVSGARISKGDLRIDLYGQVDELNSRVGMMISFMKELNMFNAEIGFLHRLQSVFFDLGSQLATEVENREKYKLPKITETFIAEMEREIDRMDSILEPMKYFILPGGTQAASSAHLCRTGARYVERLLVKYFEETQEELPENSGQLLNRASDYFFVLARYIEKKAGGTEISWIPNS